MNIQQVGQEQAPHVMWLFMKLVDYYGQILSASVLIYKLNHKMWFADAIITVNSQPSEINIYIETYCNKCRSLGRR